MNVLVATDGSQEATTALRTACRMLRPYHRNLDLLCVAPKLAGRNRGKGHRAVYERRILSEITQILEQARGTLPRDGGTVKLLPEIGSPPAVIVEKSEAYDVAVIGPRGRAATSDAGLGPVASRVVEHATAPVLIARELRSEGGLRVLVGVDGSTAALHAIETLRSLFDLDAAEVCLMHVRETPWIELGLDEDWVTYSEEEKERSDTGTLQMELTREGEAVLEQARDLLRWYRVSLTTRMDEGNPANEILSEAERGQYDLIVAGATGASDLKHRMLGGVSSKLSWSAPCSVLIVREPA